VAIASGVGIQTKIAARLFEILGHHRRLAGSSDAEYVYISAFDEIQRTIDSAATCLEEGLPDVEIAILTLRCLAEGSSVSL
jgi:hypothetical protein